MDIDGNGMHHFPSETVREMERMSSSLHFAMSDVYLLMCAIVLLPMMKCRSVLLAVIVIRSEHLLHSPTIGVHALRGVARSKPRGVAV